MDRLSATFTAVSDPTRRAILARLASGPAPVGEIARPFRISQQAVSKHLACLERARLIRRRRVGRQSVCSLRALPLRDAAEWAGGFRRLWESNFSRLDALLEELPQAGG